MKTTLRLLGPPAVHADSDVQVLPRTRPAGLLIYLGASAKWVSRAQLAYLMRADSPEKVARHYVRNLLHRAANLPGGDSLVVEPDRCRWPVESDVGRFRTAIEAERWHEALTQYGGPFAEGHVKGDSHVFDTWLETTRSDLHALWRHATLQYAADQEASGRHVRATRALRRALEYDLLDEDVLQACVRNTYLSGDRERALRLATEFESELDRDMGLEPLPATVDLLDRVRQAKSIAPAKRRERRRRRWTDAAPDPEGDLSGILNLLHDPRNRLLTLTESSRTGGDALIVARRVQTSDLALFAIVDLADSLIGDGHARRALELMILVASHGTVQPSGLSERVDTVWSRLREHLSDDLVDSARLRW